MQRNRVGTPHPSKTTARAWGRQRSFRITIMTGAFAFASLASPAAAREPSARLVDCGLQSCLQVSGHRDDPAAVVSINGRPVPVEGGRGWRVSLPVETVRAWSDPHARTIEVSLTGADKARALAVSVDLPIGLLGDITELASLEITVP